MANPLYIADTPAEVSSAKGLHLITQNTPNGQATQILLEELADAYGADKVNWGTTLINISTNEQKKEWFLRLNPNGRIPVLVDNAQSPPFPVFETSAQLLYLIDHHDPDARFGFSHQSAALEYNELVQWLFFYHGGGAPYQGQVNHFTRVAPEKIPCKSLIPRHDSLPTNAGDLGLPANPRPRRDHSVQERDAAGLRGAGDSAERGVPGRRSEGVPGRGGQGQV